METIISVLIIGVIFFHVGMYARVAYLRRHLMLGRVMDFLDREDATLWMKDVAHNAFKDTLSLKLPLSMLGSSKLKKENPELAKKISLEVSAFESEAKEHAEAYNELFEIISMMFKLNFQFNFLLFFYVAIRRCKFSIVNGGIDSVGKDLGAKYIHQS